MPYSPRFPIYIPSKSRWHNATTMDALDRLGVPYRIIVEEPQFDRYADRWGADRILVLDPEYQERYETFDDDGDTRSRGPGPARNFAWQHAIDEGHDWHWVMDDNIRFFARFHRNQRIPVADGTILHAMETFVLRYENVGMAGPEYWMFVPSRVRTPPVVLNRRVFSCNLIRNDVPLRWRGRYNEDLDLSIMMLKHGWVTMVFRAFLQYKVPTQTMSGGNTEAFYAEEGTLRKSQMAVRMHPEIVRLVRRYGRWHHDADFSGFAHLTPIRRDPPPDEPFDYSTMTIRDGEEWRRHSSADELRDPESAAAESNVQPVDRTRTRRR